MSDIGIFSTFDLFVMAMIAGAPGFAIGGLAGAVFSRRRVLGAVIWAGVGFVLCLGAVLVWLLWLK